MAAVRFSTPLSASASASASGLALPQLSDSGFASALRPRRRSRLQEKEELRQLNDRLAGYIDCVRGLSAAKSALQRRLAECEEGSRREESDVRRRFEGELAEARRALDSQAGERAALQLELRALREEHQQLLARNSKKENDLGLAGTLLRNLNAQLNSKEAQLATALSTQHSLEHELQESKDEIISLKAIVNDIRNNLLSEKLKSADLENQTKTLQEQVTFLKSLHEDELKSKKRLYESKIQEMASGCQQEFECKLLAALQELRREHEQQIREYKDRMEQNFSDKLENAQISLAKTSDLANSAQEAFLKTKLTVDTLTSQNAVSEARIRELEAQVKELQKTIDFERDASTRCLAEKDSEMAEAWQQMQAKLEDYEHLLDLKLALDLEISAYRALIEGEEQRLKLSRPSSERVGLPTATTQGRLFLQGKKRKRTGVKKPGHRVCFKVVQRSSSLGSISIEEIDAEGKFIKIKNNSDKDQSVSKWMLKRQHQNESDLMYQFPAPFALHAGQVVTIRGANEGSSPEPGDLVWKPQKSWGAGQNISIVLLKADGKKTAEGNIIYARGGGGDTEIKEDTEEEDDEMESESHKCPVM